MTEAITSGPVEFISIAGRAILAFTAVEVIRLEIAGAAAAFFDGFTLCSTMPAALGGGAVNFILSLRLWTTCTTRSVAPPSRITWARILITRKLPLHAIQRCQRFFLIGRGSAGAVWTA